MYNIQPLIILRITSILGYQSVSYCLIVHRCACTTGNRSISGYSCHIPTNSHHLLTAHTTHHLQVPVPAQKKE